MRQVRLITTLMVLVLFGKATAIAGEPCPPKSRMLNSEIKKISDDLKAVFKPYPNRDFNYLDHPEIVRAFKPNTIYNGKEITCEMGETEESMVRMHELIKTKCAEYGMDPAVVYLITLGESRGDPFIHSGGKRKRVCVKDGVAPHWDGKAAYYSMFQFGPLKHKFGVDYWIKTNLGKPPEAPKGAREIVVEYYFENYVKGKKLKGLTPIQQIALLDLGNTGATGAMMRKIQSKGYTAAGSNALYQDLMK